MNGEPDDEYSTDESGDDSIDEIEDLSGEEDRQMNNPPPTYNRWIWQVVSTRHAVSHIF
jgi:hypothetical protein